MIHIAQPHVAQIDWDGWVAPLNQYALSTGLAVSAWDAQGRRTVGPLVSSRTTRFLGTGTLWNESGAGAEFEREIVAAVVDSGAPAPDRMFHGMRVSSLPLTQSGKVYGVLVFGWCFRDFTSPLECERIAKLSGLSGQALWNEVRLEAPVSDARMATYTALLATLAGSFDRQREIIDELNRVSRARDLFLATVSHEMRTPLAALSMRVELMLRTVQDLPPAIEAGLTAMRLHVRQEAGMVDDLIDAARTLTGHMSIVPADVALGRIVRDAVSTIEPAAHEKGIAFSVAPADFGDGITLAADASRLQQVIWNLLLNAIKFTPDGGAIRVAIRDSAGHVEIDIADSGQGIAAEDLPHVFGAFTLQTSGNATGLGLGLYIARRIVELHGGTLTVDSAGTNRGTTFTIRVPRGRDGAIE
ncbi:HAMP domain-containing sensor histidine kinase [Massilia sp. R2A-15]|uniref:sensor histidine kinase n=1 Tax=Massilia sp. R2A-15 TaxID=3064278 RepID=UPI00273469CD|nr:HAMP domain-containing sensor histidine kinase [Massilia sp. R2A-15]WLI87930.1 HAMP domain-containing sensor histidine kinase [Massilia sp. R2A-15]